MSTAQWNIRIPYRALRNQAKLVRKPQGNLDLSLPVWTLTRILNNGIPLALGPSEHQSRRHVLLICTSFLPWYSFER